MTRRIGFLTCTAIVVANMIGTGVFTSLGFQVAAIPSGFVILLLWAVGAVFALCGALSYAELAAALPRSGGEYNFLTRIYGRPLGFMAGFLSATVGFSAPIAIAAMAFGRYLHAAYPAARELPASLAVVTLVTVAHSITIGSSRVFQNIFTTLKITLILVLIGSGFLIGPGSVEVLEPHPGDSSLLFSTAFAVALMWVMYSYSGWNAATYIVGEVRNPARNVPWALITGTIFVGILYIGLNSVFLKTVPMETILAEVKKGHFEIGSLSAAAIFGKDGGQLMSGLISAGLISSLSAMTWAGPRVASTIGEDFRSLRILAYRSAGGVPVVATTLQFVTVVLLILTSSFDSVVLYTQFALVICSLLTVFGVIVLRTNEPNLPRPFKCWGYPVTPLLFAGTAIFALAYTAIVKPWEALAGVGTLLLALAIYFLGRWWRGKSRNA